MFKNCRNYPKKYYLCQKPAKSGSARIWICVLTRAHNLCHDNCQLMVLAINCHHSAIKTKII